jgi:RNA polymerase sigma-70 factor, ECF subfamily
MLSVKILRSESKDADLARRAGAGEVSAFEQLVRRHGAMAIGAALRITHDRGLAEDAAQEAFWKAFRALPEYREKQRFAGWLRTIVVRCALDLIRRRRPEIELERTEQKSADNRDEKQQEDRRLLEHALSHISSLDREIILALKADGRSVAEVAEELSMTKTAVRVRAYRALRKLRKILMEEL